MPRLSLLLDTSILVDFLRQRDKEKTRLYKLAAEHTDMGISIITQAELYAGKGVWESKRAQRELTALLSGLAVAPITEEISRRAGQLRARSSVHLLDALIAATALAYRIPLATMNAKDFAAIRGLKLRS
ncbi:MAG: type II toxin-antitoxin system VapC family toxin [Candidatus Andersenbacteria bacterium]|nr:type II toxin-antitoxin system VapC family toxin [Candidatus Andersenbacteria bacterium]